MNCLACQGVVRTNSDNEGDFYYKTSGLWIIEEKDEILTQSAPLKPDYGKMRSSSSIIVPLVKNFKNVPRRSHSTVAGLVEDQPKLVRSSGMRRDWSFEDLRRTVKAN